jgi:hypothetical protein
MRNPNLSVFAAPFQDYPISVEHILSEIFRLYPPTLLSIATQTRDGEIDIEFLYGDQVT